MSAPPEGFQPLFDGSTLANWHGQPQLSPEEAAAADEQTRAEWAAEAEKHWSVSEGEVVNDGHGPYLTTDKNFRDFELLIQYNTDPGADSGIYLRGVPQVQIWDPFDDASEDKAASVGSGGLFNNDAGAPGKDPLVKADRPPGEWNQFRIRLIGERCWVWLNGEEVVRDARMANYFNREGSLPLEGPIQLQTHGGKVRWRNAFVRELGSEEANATLREADLADGQPDYLFNGLSLPQWDGATSNYEAVLRCKEGKGGVLFSRTEYDDFETFIEFRLPPAGNNGLVIRYPVESGGKSDGAYAAMTELQILDDGHPKYASLDPRQAHGSAYGMAAARRGYLRPTGEWNYQKVIVRGPTIVVELNGTVILETDLSKIDDYMDDKPHPGKDRTRGAVGLAGHTDPVEFRLVAVRPIGE